MLRGIDPVYAWGLAIAMRGYETSDEGYDWEFLNMKWEGVSGKFPDRKGVSTTSLSTFKMRLCFP